MSGVDRILWIYVQQSYLGTTDVAIGGDNGLYLPGEKQYPGHFYLAIRIAFLLASCPEFSYSNN